MFWNATGCTSIVGHSTFTDDISVVMFKGQPEDGTDKLYGNVGS